MGDGSTVRMTRDEVRRDIVEGAEAAAAKPTKLFQQFTALGAAQRHLQANLNPELTLDILGLRLQRRGQQYGTR